MLIKFLEKLLKTKSGLIVYVFALLSRIWSLGYDNINSDAYLWKQRGYEFTSAITSLNLEKTLVSYHPGVTLLYNLFVANKLYSILNRFYFNDSLAQQQVFFVNHAIQKFILVVFTSVLVLVLFLMVSKVIGLFKAYIFTIILVLEPIFIALSREVHTDAIETLTIAISLIAFYIYLNNKNIKNRYLLISSTFLGLSLLTKSSALILPFFFGIYAVVVYFTNRENHFKKLFAVYALSVIVFVILWPVMLIDPLTAIHEYFIKGIKGVGVEEGHEHVWYGVSTLNPGILFYPIVIAARYSIELFYLFIVFIITWIIRVFYVVFYKKSVIRNINFSTGNFVLYVASFSALYLIILTLSSKKLDRYSLVLLPGIIFMAVHYLDKLFSRKIIYFILLLLCILRGYFLYALSPNYLAYYSPVVGGIYEGMYIVEPKWPVGYDRVAEYFNRQKDARNLKIAIAEHDYLRPFGIFQTLNIKHDAETVHADYLVLPIYREARNEYYINRYGLTKPKEKIEVAGVIFYLVYKNNKKIQ